MPYGHGGAAVQSRCLDLFQSLIWVACPTGNQPLCGGPGFAVSIPHMGCMPYGPSYRVLRLGLRISFNPSYGLHALRAVAKRVRTQFADCGFNPSYGLHALRAYSGMFYVMLIRVSIPHMGCMPYGPQIRGRLPSLCLLVSIPHMGCMPYGLSTTRLFNYSNLSFNPSYGLHALRAHSRPRIRQ